MLFTTWLIVCWGTASHSSCREALRSLKFWGTELQTSTQRLSWSHRSSMGFRSWEIWGTPVSISRSLMMQPPWAGALTSMKMKLGLCCSCNDWINVVIQVVWACHCTKCRAVLYWLDTAAHTVTPPPPKACLVTTVADTQRSPWCLQHRWRPSFLLNLNQLSSQRKCSLPHARRWRLCLVVWSVWDVAKGRPLLAFLWLFQSLCVSVATCWWQPVTL